MTVILDSHHVGSLEGWSVVYPTYMFYAGLIFIEPHIRHNLTFVFEMARPYGVP